MDKKRQKLDRNYSIQSIQVFFQKCQENNHKNAVKLQLFLSYFEMLLNEIWIGVWSNISDENSSVLTFSAVHFNTKKKEFSTLKDFFFCWHQNNFDERSKLYSAWTKAKFTQPPYFT